MGTMAFEFLRYFGFPFNCKRRPSVVQVAVHFVLALLFSANLVPALLSVTLWESNWFATVIVQLLMIIRVIVTVLFLIVNLKTSSLEVFIANLEAVPIKLKAKNYNDWLLVGLSSIFINTIIFFISFNITLPLYVVPMFMGCDVVLYISLAQYVTPLYSINDKMFQVRSFLYTYSLKENFNHKKDTWRLILRQRRLEGIFLEMVQNFYSRIMLVVFCSTYGATVFIFYAVGTVGGFIYSNQTHCKIAMVFLFIYSAIYEFYKIWCIRHFYCQLYSLCLEDTTGTLVSHDIINVHLERRKLIKSSKNRKFLLDHSLFFSVISTTVTLLFIIIQFQIHDESCEEEV
ncbi:Gustatory receptor 189 [Halyomorpha halys]|nr:Gustatory receptor 189 [Halyomorpha halys]